MGLPKKKAGGESSLIDLAVVQISSMYDAPSALVPTILATVETNLEAGYTQGVKCLIGSSAAGIVSTVPDLNTGDADTKRNIRTVENEGGYGVSITFALLPDVELQVSTHIYMHRSCYLLMDFVTLEKMSTTLVHHKSSTH